MAEIRTCWAFNSSGQRCEHPAGHPGNHVITATWTDDECFSPIRHQLPEPATAVKENTPIPLPEPLAHEPLKCVGCGHQHKGGPCKCGCHEQIG